MIRIGTRRSKLALWQAQWVMDRLTEQGLAVELRPMDTIGDKKLDTSIAKIGSKGVFTEELEELLSSGEIDLAVHSAKDLSSRLPKGFRLVAFGPRAQAHDVILADKPIDLQKPLILGSSGTRRVAQMKRRFPHIEIHPVRGNLQTRIEKMRQGPFDGLILAYAGVDRMGFNDLIQYEFPLREHVTAAGQGIIAVECHESLPEKIQQLVYGAINDEHSEHQIRAERSFLYHVDGGCSIPVFAHAFPVGNKLEIDCGILSLDGKEEIRVTKVGTHPDDLGEAAAHEMLSLGGSQILREIKKELYL